jgi:hypothetical protein
LPDVTTTRRTGSDECLDLQQDVDILYHSEKAASEAKQIGKKVGLGAGEILTTSAEDLKKCGGGEMLAIPAAIPSELDRMKDRATGTFDKAQQEVKQKIGAATKKAGEEVKKGKDKIHP